MDESTGTPPGAVIPGGFFLIGARVAVSVGVSN